METLLARSGKQKKKASSAKKQRGRRAQAEKHSGSFVRVGGVAYATKGGNACGWRLPQGATAAPCLRLLATSSPWEIPMTTSRMTHLREYLPPAAQRRKAAVCMRIFGRRER